MDCFCSKLHVTIQCKIILLDEQELIHEMPYNSSGQQLLDIVFHHLNLLETAYFGLRYLDPDGQTHWLDPAKKLNRQLKFSEPYILYFGVKFYAADPCKLLEEITRYQFFLQVKQDIFQGRLPVPFELAAELGAYIVQSELGDYDSRRHGPGYVSEFRFLSNQTVELETRIAELHKTLVGQLPSVAEINYLDKVKWLEMYGVDLHPVLGEDNVEYFLGLTPSGIIVLRNKNTVGNYYWPRISKIYFKGRYFMLRVTDKNNDESTYGFETPSKAACKHLWKCCVEHHAFFRLVQVSPTTPDIFALGSRFKYSGRTENQAVRDAQLKARTPPSFSRTPSRRYNRRIVDSHDDSFQLDESLNISRRTEVKHVSIPQPAQQTFENPFRVSGSTNDLKQRIDSPRSTRSAPWTQPHSRGLYNSSIPSSPRSVRSMGARYRSSSVDSQSSNESRTCRRRKHRSRMTSDNESELSKCSNRSHRKHRRHRSRGNRRDSGSEQDVNHSRKKSASRSRDSDSHYELVDSGSQWREIQRRQTKDGNICNVQQANVVSNRRQDYHHHHQNSLETESELCYRSNRQRKQKKHKSLSHTPDGRAWLPDELKKHLEFDLIDTEGMSEKQLKEIPYTAVKTNNAKHLKPKMKHLQWSESNEKMLHDDKHTDSPPPPYTPIEISRISSATTRNQLHPQSNNNNNNNVTRNSSPACSSIDYSTIHSNNSISKKSMSLGLPDGFPYNNGSQRSSRGNHCSGYHNPNEHPRVFHEHTDSGLGGEQDCNFASERYQEHSNHEYLRSDNGTKKQFHDSENGFT